MKRKYRLLREAAYEEGLASFADLIAIPTFRDFVVLYIAEGYKRDRNSVSIANSDPEIVALAARWISLLSDRQPVVRVQHHADQDVVALRAFWAEVAPVDPDRVRFYRKSNSGELRRRVWRCAHGVAAVEVYDTLLKARRLDRLREARLGVD